MIARIVKWWRDLRRTHRENQEALETIAGMRRRGHFAPYTVAIGHTLTEPKAQKQKRVANYVEWRAVLKNGKPYRNLVTCPYCHGRARLGLKHPCPRAKKVFVINRPGFYQSLAS
jgi:hypothetical protein